MNPVFVAVPTLFVTLTLPDEPDPTTAFILTDVSETILKDAAGVPPKLTAVTLLKLLPRITTVVPVVADAGKKVDINGEPGGAV